MSERRPRSVERFMRQNRGTCGKVMTTVAILILWSGEVMAQQKDATFELTASLPKSTIHLGEDLVVEVITSNPTDHIVYAVYAVNGGAGSVDMELLNDKGEDSGQHAMGNAAGVKVRDSGVILYSRTPSLRPGTKQDLTWRFKPEPGYLVPGVYRLRIHRRDARSQVELYSNTIDLTVVP
jgi:hypothetical protein